MKNAVSFSTILLVLLFASTLLAKDVWLETNSDNFQLVGNVGEQRLKEVALKLESFHDEFEQSFSRSKVKIPFPTKVIVLREDQHSFIKTQSFLEAEDANYISILLKDGSLEIPSKIFHNYAFYLIKNNFGQANVPLWLSRGIAEYISNPDNQNFQADPNEKDRISLDKLLETDYYTFQIQTEERKSQFIIQSKAFLSFLITEKSNGSFEKIERYVELLRNGKDLQDAGISVFGANLRKLENEYSQSFKRQKSQAKNNPSSNIETNKLQFSVISEAMSLAVIGNFLYYSNQLKQAAELVKNSLNLDENQTLALTTLALIKVDQLSFDEAEKLAEKATQLEPENFLNHYRLALILSKQGMTEYGFVSGYKVDLADKIRDSLTKAIALNPAFSESYSLFAFVDFVRNEVSDKSFESINNALRIAPGNQKYLLRLAELNLRKANFSEARRLVLNVLQTTESEKLHLYSENTLLRIDSTEYQLLKKSDPNVRYVNSDIVTDEPLSDEEIKKLREKAVADQIKSLLRRPFSNETKVVASLLKIECEKENISFVFSDQTSSFKLSAKSFDDIIFVSFSKEMSHFRLGCGIIAKENKASIIYKKRNDYLKFDELISIEFVPTDLQL